MRAVIYTRASLDRTGEGKSNSRQHEECLRLCDFKRWEVVGHEADHSISAYVEKERPAWNRVLSLIEEGEVDVVVAFHLDRLTRNMADLEKLILLCEKHNVSVATATGDIDLTNDTGRMVARILAAVARQEVERKAARQKLAHVQRRAEGRPWSAVKMLGYTNEGEIIEQEAEPIRQAARDVLDDAASLAEIGRRWAEMGLDSPYRKDKAKPWSARSVKLILTNPRTAGFVVQDGEILGKGKWEPIISETDLTILTAKLTAPDRRLTSNSGGPKALNLLTGIMRCSKCGETVRAGSNRGTPTYICPNWETYVPREAADEVVRSAFASTVALVSPGGVLSVSQGDSGPEAAEEEIERLRERQGVLARSFARGLTPEDAYEAAVEDISDQIKALEEQVEGSHETKDLVALRDESVRNFLDQDRHEQRRVLERLSEVVMHPPGGRRVSARDQLEVKVKVRDEMMLAHSPRNSKAPSA